MSRVLVIGLDCLAPEVAFRRFRDDFPTLNRLADGGVRALLRSTVPPITVPAWRSMATGKDPGTLGVYGLRNRIDRSYREMAVASAAALPDDTVWDIAGRHSRRVIVVGVPLTYPPRPVHGDLVACFLTPSAEVRFTHPEALRAEIDRIAGGYVIDVPDYRTDDRDRVLADIRAMTEKRFRVTAHLMAARDWELVFHVEMGPDRLHHAFWRFIDPQHRAYDPGSPYVEAVRAYCRELDAGVARLVEAAGDEAAVIVVSDHGAKAIDGGFRINQWLIDQGDLVLRKPPGGPSDLRWADIDWPRTKAWGAGGYYARVFLNVAGREPQGAVPSSDAASFRDDLARRLAAVTGPDGEPWDTRIHRPEAIYRAVNGVPPDLIVYLDDLRWRSANTVGAGSVYADGNDTGPDEANHAQHGVFALNRRPAVPTPSEVDILDVAPTVLDLLGVPIPADVQGRSLFERTPPAGHTPRQGSPHPSTPDVYTEEERRAVESRLRALGYL